MIRRISIALVLLSLLLPLGASIGAPMPGVHAAPMAAPAAVHVARPAAFFDKTRVIIHLAIAFGVFHHWVYKPFRAGDISIHHPIKLIKAGAALLFAVHEIRKAIDITSHSNSDTLKAVNGAITGLADKFANIGTLFQKNPASLTDAQVSSSLNDLNSGVD